MNSLWSKTVNMPEFEALSGDKKTDVLIVGGGITGILCAYMLKEAGVDYMLVEANRICCGVTQNTTAKITSQHGLMYHKLLKRFGTEKAAMYLQANQLALAEYVDLCQNIPCDFAVKDNFVYSIHQPRKLEQELEALHKIGCGTPVHCPSAAHNCHPFMHPSVEFAEHLPLPFPVAGAVKFAEQAQFHPLKFFSGLAKELNIHEHTKVLEFAGQKVVTGEIHDQITKSQTYQKHLVKTNHGNISADKIIIATHFPIINKHGMYFLKMYQHRSYVLALDHAPQLNGMYVDEAEKGLSFRNYDDLLLLGGGSHRTGKHGGNWAELTDFAHGYYPKSHIRYQWATQDCMPLDDIPYIGPYSRNTSGIYTATGFHKWGMTSAMTAAMILRDMILEKDNPFAPVFNPSRTMLRPQLFINAFEATTNLFTPTQKRCPHMGCALKWNPVEHTWDCPCHGSRFTKDGELIDNPATDDLNFRP